MFQKVKVLLSRGRRLNDSAHLRRAAIKCSEEKGHRELSYLPLRRNESVSTSVHLQLLLIALLTERVVTIEI